MKICMCITGGGSSFIHEFMKNGGISPVLVDIQIPYSTESLSEYLGYTPAKFCDAETTFTMATTACVRAQKLSNEQNTVGLALNCSLKKENQREGRKNNYHFVLLHSSGYHYQTTVVLDSDLTREEQEKLIAENCIPILLEFLDIVETGYYLGISKNQQIPKVVYPGSFNPYHAGHRAIVDRVASIYNQGVALELSIKNVDKPDLTTREISDRIRQSFGENVYGVYIVQLPKFSDKIKFYEPDTVFVIGTDTFNRMFDKKYYNSEEEYNEFVESIKKVKLHIIPRTGYPIITFDENTNWVYDKDFVSPDISSTEIRKGIKNG